MEIYILRDGKEIGPFSEKTTKTLLSEGSIREVDYAWHAGLPKWLPLSEVLSPATRSIPEARPAAPLAAADSPAKPAASSGEVPKTGESATEKQKALLGYLRIPFPSGISKDQAALLINDAMEDSKNGERLVQWNTDRLKLHPDLFAAEIASRKESRVGDFFEICQTEGAEYFTKITKAHCQVLVGYLDVKFPNWDADEKGAAQKYFFPAVAEKFPQLVAKQWKGKLRYATGPKIATELGDRRSSGGKAHRRKPATALPLVAIVRGVVFGVIILAMIYFVQKVLNVGSQRPATPDKTSASSVPKPDASVDPVANPDPLAPGDPEKMAAQPETSIPAGAPPPPDTAQPSPADPQMAKPVDPLATKPQSPANPANLADPADPLTTKTAMPAALPGFPPDPPLNGNTVPSGDPLAPANSPPAAPDDTVVPAKTSLRLTKPIEVQLAYGKMKLPAGTSVKLVSRDGNFVKVNYLNTLLTVPIASTDYATADAPPPAVAPPATPPASTPAPTTTITPSADL